MLFPIHIELHRSRILLLLLLVVHTAAAGSVWILPWPPALRWLLLALIVISTWHSLRPCPVVGLHLSEGGRLRLLCAAGDSFVVSVRPDTVVFHQLIVLRVRDDEQRWQSTLTLLPDSMPAEQFRLLRLWLRWCADPSERARGDV